MCRSGKLLLGEKNFKKLHLKKKPPKVFPRKGFHKLEKIYPKKPYEPDLIW